MNRRFLTIIGIAFAVAALATLFVYRIIAKQISARSKSVTVPVVVAAKDLPVGVLLRSADLKLTEAVAPLPKGALVNIEAAVNRGVVSPMYEGELVLESRLAAAGSGGGLAAMIKPGMRACAVKVDEVVGVAGFVLPGMRVDVLISGNAPGVDPSSGTKVKTILQNIAVLSAGTNIQKDSEGKPASVQVVNLLVTPEQAEVLSLASNQTKIQLVLRNPVDTQVTNPPGTAMTNLFGGAPAPTLAGSASGRRAAVKAPLHIESQAEPRILLVEIMNGSDRKQQKFTLGEDGK